MELLGVTVVPVHIIRRHTVCRGNWPEIPSHDLVSGYQSDAYLFCGLS